MLNSGANDNVIPVRQVEPDCLRCRHFQITWEVENRYGCKAFGFKSNRIPSREVFAVGGTHCLAYTEREVHRSTVPTASRRPVSETFQLKA